MSLPVVNAEFRAAADPELRFAPSGVAVCKIRAVASSRKKNENDEWVDDKTCWVNLTGFKRLAENMAESFQKGDLMMVVGKIYTDDWEDKDGNKRTSISVNVDQIGMSAAFNPVKPVKGERPQQSQPQQQAQPTQQNDPWATGQDDQPPF